MTENSSGPLYCYNHPQRETYLRCNRCNRPICNSCAVLTPTGYRCKECVRGQQKIFDTAQWWDYPLAVLVAGGLAMLGSLLAGILGFFAIFVGPIAGMIITEAVRWVVRRHRSRALTWLTAAATLAGALLLRVVPILVSFASLFQGGIGSLLGLIWPVVFAILAASTVYYRMSGIQL